MSFRFTIRDLLWLTALVAVCVAWWVDRSKRVAELAACQQELQIERKEMAGYIDFDRQHGVGVDVNAMYNAIRKLQAEKK